MPLIEFSTDGIGNGKVSYSIVKFRIRKRWALVSHNTGSACVAAYFTDPGEARLFATTFGLTITEGRAAFAEHPA